MRELAKYEETSRVGVKRTLEEDAKLENEIITTKKVCKPIKDDKKNNLLEINEKIIELLKKIDTTLSHTENKLTNMETTLTNMETTLTYINENISDMKENKLFYYKS
jgi:hypothetical protein